MFIDPRNLHAALQNDIGVVDTPTFGRQRQANPTGRAILGGLCQIFQGLHD